MRPAYLFCFCALSPACGTKTTTSTQPTSADASGVGGATSTSTGGTVIVSSAGAASISTGGTATASSAGAGYALAPGCAPSGTYACNPVTNLGCNQSNGEACDDDLQGGFMCYAPPNDVALGGACNIVDGPSCSAGMVCNGASDTNANGICAKYCCSNQDCSGSAVCVSLDTQYGTLGFCQ